MKEEEEVKEEETTGREYSKKNKLLSVLLDIMKSIDKIVCIHIFFYL